MRRAEIEKRISMVQKKLQTENNLSTIATLNRCLDRLIMMEASDDGEVHPHQTTRN